MSVPTFAAAAACACAAAVVAVASTFAVCQGSCCDEDEVEEVAPVDAPQNLQFGSASVSGSLELAPGYSSAGTAASAAPAASGTTAMSGITRPVPPSGEPMVLPGAHEDFHRFDEAGAGADPEDDDDGEILPGASEEFFQFADEEALERSR